MRKYSKVYKKKTKIFSKIKIINSREKQQKDVFCPEHHFLSLKAEPTPPGFTCSDIIKSSLARRKRSDKTIWQTGWGSLPWSSAHRAAVWRNVMKNSSRPSFQRQRKKHLSARLDEMMDRCSVGFVWMSLIKLSTDVVRVFQMFWCFCPEDLE